MTIADAFAQIVPADSDLNDEQRRVVLEIAATAAAADRVIHRDEIAALEVLAQRLGRSAEAEFASMFKKLGERIEPEKATKQLRVLSIKLESAEARELAYKAAWAITLVDKESSPREESFGKDLANALSLKGDAASRLAEEVQALMPAD
jgi:hypothetical protein